MSGTAGWDKQPASRPFKYQVVGWTGSGTALSTYFTSQTYQIRICSQTAGWAIIDSTRGDLNGGTIPTTAGGIGEFVPASTVGGEYFTVSPGQSFLWASTSTSSFYISITEMA